MTQKTLDETIAQLEREMSETSGQQRAEAAERLRKLLLPKTPAKSEATDSEEDLFDNMPI
ncbi:MAG: hypothetical protein ACSHXB_06100 [Sulfitobacter sp.]